MSRVNDRSTMKTDASTPIHRRVPLILDRLHPRLDDGVLKILMSSLFQLKFLHPVEYLPEKRLIHKARSQFEVQPAAGFDDPAGDFDDACPDGFNLHGLLAIRETEGPEPVGQVIRQQAQHHLGLIDLERVAIHPIETKPVFDFLDIVFHRAAFLVGPDDIFGCKGVHQVRDIK